MQKPLVCLISSTVSSSFEDVDLERSILDEIAELQPVLIDDPRQPREPLRRSEAFIVISSLPKITRALLEESASLRVVVRAGVGFDNVDTDAACTLSIPVCNVPDYGTEEVADHAIMLALALERHLLRCVDGVRASKWSWQAAVPTHRLRGQCFGVVGCGRIGTAAALRAKGFGFRVLIYDPYVASGYEKALGVERVGTLGELLEAADVVTLHAPLTAETRGMIGESELARMKPGAFLINTARGPLIQERALVGALQRGGLGGAALDVVENEPAFSPELLAHPNCLITPHAAFYSEESVRDMRTGAARIVRRILEGGAPINVVNGVPSARRAA